MRYVKVAGGIDFLIDGVRTPPAGGKGTTGVLVPALRMARFDGSTKATLVPDVEVDVTAAGLISRGGSLIIELPDLTDAATVFPHIEEDRAPYTLHLRNVYGPGGTAQDYVGVNALPLLLTMEGTDGAGVNQLGHRLLATVRGQVTAQGAPGPAGPPSTDVDPEVVEAAVDAAAPAAVQSAIYENRTSKNLFNPADPDVLVDKVPAATKGNYTTLANYRVSGFIPVTPALQYALSSLRYYEWYDASKVSLAVATNTGSNAATAVVTAPAGAAFLRATHHYVNNPFLQVERGSVVTGYEGYFPGSVQDVDPQFAFRVAAAARVGPLTVTKNGSTYSISREVAGKTLTENITLTGGTNLSFDLTSVLYDGVLIHTVDDDTTPLRSQQGTIGADHGFDFVRAFTNPDAKTVADVGSVWTDGTREHVLLAIDTSGRPVFGGAPTTDSNGVTSSAVVAPVANLTHVSGATKTAAVDRTTIVVSQLRPGGQYRRTATVLADNAPFTVDGARSCREFVVIENYEIPDYGSLYALSKANIGTPVIDLPVAPAMSVQNVWRWTGGGCLVTTELVEIKPTTLSELGSVQSAIMAKAGATVTRYMPGVGTVNGKDFHAGVDMSSWSATQIITSAHLTNPNRPPTMTLDVLATGGVPEIGFAMGYLPAGRRGDEASRDTQRLARSSGRLWDLRNSKKNYPNWTTGEAAGWGVLRTAAFRAYLSPTQIATVLAARPNPLATTQKLMTLTGLAT